ncbi:MAG: ABC-F family ATP-binding cassette domain-containing protein [Coriobacteriales bacterium]|jgi:ATP-binding cassette subfamily F protein uup
MAFALGCEDIHLEYAVKTLFDGVTLGVDEGDRVGIVGRNGDGKSSLLGILAQTVEPDAGRVFKRNDFAIGMLAQDDAFAEDDTIVGAIFGDTPEYVWASDPRIRDILDHLVGTMPLDSRIDTLSGGERRRVDLARVLIGTDEILMLDEPTNHLDIATISWLAGHLNRRWPGNGGALLVVTHDRWFLDEVCTSMWEVHDGVVEPFEGGYSAYVLQRVEREEAARVAEQKRQNLLRRELAWLSRGARARATKPKFHVEAAEALIADVPPMRDTLELKRAAVARLGKQAVDLVNVSKSFEGKRVLDDVSWIIAPGDRVGILGDNGAGKTTLLKLITGAVEPDSGYVKIGKTVKISVLSQRLEELDEFGDYEVREVLTRYKTHYTIDGKELSSSQLLERLGFNRAHFQLPVSHLSGGQKRRLQLMLTLLEGSNVLILDEPGNDMDVDMLGQIESVLDTWPGTLILVTHDRHLMERVTDNQYALVGGKVRHLPGGVDEYLRIAAQREPESQFGVPTGDGGKREAKDAPGLTNAERQAARKKLSSAERKIETTQEKLAQAEQALRDADPTDYEELIRCENEIAALRERLDDLELEWLELSDILG